MAKPRNLLRTLANVSSMTLLSRIMGFVRDMLMAKYFGAGFATDAFFVAFKLPNLLRRIFAEGAFSSAFVPILAQYKLNKSHLETKAFISHIAGLLSLVLVVIVIIGILLAGKIILITAPGFIHSREQYVLASRLLQITFPYILFISLASLVGGVLNTWDKFSIPAITPIILNLSFIVFIVFFRQYFTMPIYALAWAVFVGGLLQLIFQIIFLKSIDMNFIPKLNLRDSAVWNVIKRMLPSIFAMSISQINMLINTIFASFLAHGSISWMYYADRLMEFPTGIFGAALGTILLPSLSKHAHSRNQQLFSSTLDWGIKLTLILVLPASIGLALISKQLIMVLFMHGSFNLHDVIMTQRALVAYSIGLIGLILVKVLAPGFYANNDVKTPVKIAICSLVLAQIMNSIFIYPLQHAGLALSIGLAACFNAFCLGYFLIKKGFYTPSSDLIYFTSKVIAAVIIMTICLSLTLNLTNFNYHNGYFKSIMALLFILSIAIVSYFISLFSLGFRLHQFKQTN